MLSSVRAKLRRIRRHGSARLSDLNSCRRSSAGLDPGQRRRLGKSVLGTGRRPASVPWHMAKVANRRAVPRRRDRWPGTVSRSGASSPTGSGGNIPGNGAGTGSERHPIGEIGILLERVYLDPTMFGKWGRDLAWEGGRTFRPGRGGQSRRPRVNERTPDIAPRSSQDETATAGLQRPHGSADRPEARAREAVVGDRRSNSGAAAGLPVDQKTRRRCRRRRTAP